MPTWSASDSRICKSGLLYTFEFLLASVITPITFPFTMSGTNTREEIPSFLRRSVSGQFSPSPIRSPTYVRLFLCSQPTTEPSNFRQIPGTNAGSPIVHCLMICHSVPSSLILISDVRSNSNRCCISETSASYTSSISKVDEMTRSSRLITET